MDTGFAVFELNHPWVDGGPVQRVALYVLDQEAPVTVKPERLVMEPGTVAETSIPFGSWPDEPLPDNDQFQ